MTTKKNLRHKVLRLNRSKADLTQLSSFFAASEHAIQKTKTTASAIENIRIIKTPAGLGLIATETIPAGRTVIDFTGQLLRTSRVTRFHHAMQVGRDRFLEASPEALDNFINHSCSPTCRVDFDEQALVSITTIPAGWELTYDYESTEYDLESQGCAFSCKCGSLQCRGRIRGFRFLKLPVKLALRSRLSPFLAEQLDAELSKAGDRSLYQTGH